MSRGDFKSSSSFGVVVKEERVPLLLLSFSTFDNSISHSRDLTFRVFFSSFAAMGIVSLEPAQVGHVRRHASRLCRPAPDEIGPCNGTCAGRQQSMGCHPENSTRIHRPMRSRAQIHNLFSEYDCVCLPHRCPPWRTARIVSRRRY